MLLIVGYIYIITQKVIYGDVLVLLMICNCCLQLFYKSLNFCKETAVTRPGQFFPKSTHPEVMFKKNSCQSDFGARRSIHSKLVSSPHFGGHFGFKTPNNGGRAFQNPRKYTFSEHAKHLYRARKRVCRVRMALETS